MSLQCSADERVDGSPFLWVADDVADEADENLALIAALQAELAAEVTKLAQLPAAKAKAAATDPKVLCPAAKAQAAAKTALAS